MTFEEFAAYLQDAAEKVEPNLQVALFATTQAAAEAARGYIGHYQGAAGPVPAWPPLAESTVRDKVSKGYSPPDHPLLRTGDMRDSITAEVDGMIGVVGSDSKIALYQEMGTHRIPPRPFLALAAWESIPKFEEELNAAAVRIFEVG